MIDVQAILLRIPTVARLYYTGLGARRYKRASTQSGPGEPLVHRSHVERELHRLVAEQVGAAASEYDNPTCEEEMERRSRKYWAEFDALAAPSAAIAAREQEASPNLLDVLITANDGSGNTWTRIEVLELAEGLEAIASAAVMDGSKMRGEDADRDREWCRHQATYAALALRALTQSTTVQQGLTEEQIRDGFRDYDKELVARHRTPWQIWRDSSAWTQSALKGMQPGERGAS